MEEATNLEAEAPEVEALPETEEVEAETPELDEYGNPVEEPDPEPETETDLADVEYEGKAYKLPPELKDALLRQADYTRKTQEVAEARRQVEATLQAVSQASEAELQARTAVGVIDTQLAEFANIDWDAWELQDPTAASRGWRQYQALKDQRQNAVAQFSQAQQQRISFQQQETAKRLEQGVRELAAKIPEWSQDKAAKLLDFGTQNYGFSREELAGIDDPRVIIALHDAFQFRQQQTAKQAKPAPKQVVQPAAKVKGGRPAVSPLDDRANTDTWMKARMAQLSKR